LYRHKEPDMDEKVAVLFVVAMGVCLTMFVVHSWRRARERRETEQTKREIAAYVAEGSITPDDGVKLLQAGRTHDAASMIADGVAGGMISAAKAERLFRTRREGATPAQAAASRA
jgi:hypothetical protein